MDNILCSFVVTEPPVSKSVIGQTLEHRHISDVFPDVIQDIIARHSVIKVSICKHIPALQSSRILEHAVCKLDAVCKSFC